ncbi:MAG TPA: YceI family protein [Candidatus Dormibacteraeota bacterium]
MRNRLVIAGAAVAAAAALVGAGAYVYFFSGLRSSPSPLALSAATPSGTPSTGTLAGKWTVAGGSVAGYRVNEVFVGTTSNHEAVARTSSVSGRLTVSGDSSGYQVNAITITAVLTDLHSVDSVAGRDVSQRDGFVARSMNLQQYPNATFTASSATVTPTTTGQPVQISLPGTLTIRGVTKNVTANIQAQQNGTKVEVSGKVAIDMTDYGVAPPSVPFTAVDSKVTIEFDIFLTKTG